MCRHTREPTVLSRVTCSPFHLNVDRFHQPCLLPWRNPLLCHRNTAGCRAGIGGACRIPVPRGGHLPLRAALRLTGGFCHPDWTVPRQDVNSSFSPCMCHPSRQGVCTHADSGPLRVRRLTPSPWPSMGSTLADKVLKKTPLDLQKRFPIYRAGPKYLAARCCGSAFPENDLAFHQDLDEVGKTLVDW